MLRNTATALTFLLLFSNTPSPLHAEQVSAAKSEELVKHLDDTNFEKTVKESKVPVLVDFYATWCEPCKRMSPRLEELAKEYEGKLLVVKVDVDRCPKLKAKYGISRLPTLYLLKPGGATSKSSTGEKTLDGLRDFVKDAVKQ